MTGTVLSILLMVTVLVVTLPAASVATKVKLPFAVKVWLVVLSVP